MAARLTIPIFPLNTVLYPGGMLTLKIFEQRYLEMTKACLKDAAPFGVCRISEGLEVGVPAVPDTVGCTAMIVHWEMPHLGVFDLKIRGQRPFRILTQTIEAIGLIRAEVELLDDARGNPDEEAFKLCRRVLEKIISRIGADGFFPPPEYDDPRWISYRLAEVLPLGTMEKQALLQTRQDGERVSLLHAFLKRAT